MWAESAEASETEQGAEGGHMGTGWRLTYSIQEPQTGLERQRGPTCLTWVRPGSSNGRLPTCPVDKACRKAFPFCFTSYYRPSSSMQVYRCSYSSLTGQAWGTLFQNASCFMCLKDVYVRDSASIQAPWVGMLASILSAWQS